MEGESVLSFGTIVLLSIWEAAKGMSSPLKLRSDSETVCS